jgi:hypothetical protein
MGSKVKPTPYMVMMAVITAALSTWGLYRLAVDFAEMPPLLAVLTVAGFDIFAVACGKQALDVARDGDSSAPWNALLVLFALLSSVMQFGHAVLAGWPALVGVMMAAFPIATVCLFEGTLRRAYRLNGRRDGRVAPPRATFDLLMWIFYRRLTLQAFRMAILDRGLDADTATALAERQLQLDADAAAVPQRRQIQRSYAHLLDGGTIREIGADLDAEPVQELRPVNGRARGDITKAVRAAVEEHGDNLPAVVAAVRSKHPDVAEDTVRRTLTRLGGAA